MASSENSNNVNVSFVGLFGIMFTLMFLTGNCESCGGKRNYVGEYMDNQKALDKVGP